MGTRTAILSAAAVLACGPAHAQPFRLGMALSTDFITALVRRELSTSQVAVINGSVGTAMIFNRDLSAGPVVFIGGSGNFVWAQIAQQLSDAAATVVVDATALRIITAENDSWAFLEPNGSLNPPLQQAQRISIRRSRVALGP